MSAQNTSGTLPATEKLSTPERRRSGTVGTAAAIGIAVVLLIVGLAGGYFLGTSLNKSTTSSKAVQITETGSSLLYPLMTRWAGNYSAATVSAASTGSGTGQSDAELGLVNIGASDGYLSNASATGLINVPVAISAQLIYYNLPGISANLNLNGTILAMIYEGAITTWNNPLILAAQPTGVQSELNALSSQTIHPIKRSDSSGDTFLFTSMCYMSWSGWTYGNSTSALTGDTLATGATGNSGVVSALGSTTNSIGYVGISYESSANALGLHYAALGDNNALSAAGGVAAANYILPSAQNISYDANLGLGHLEFSTYQLAVSLILGGSAAGAIDLVKGAGGTAPTTASPTPYPDANLEYTLIKTAPTGSTVTSAALAATVAFLEWAITIGNWAPGSVPSAYINAVNFIPLTPEVAGYDLQELASVQP
ncbi:MAG: substrate-binding domain-containing protein [Thermoplasmata archaeon]